MSNHTSKRRMTATSDMALGVSRTQALREVGQVLYAIRQPAEIIKIGCTRDLANRASTIGGELLAFTAGDFDDEIDLHRRLAASVARGREWYHPTAEVMAVVNEWRTALRLPAA